MKKITILTILVAALSFASCNKWLDIQPEDTITETQLFSDAGGYHSAINGLYQTLASKELYGKNLTWGFVSALSQYYDNGSSTDSKEFSYTEKYEYDKDEVRNIAEEIWQTGYNVIANANNILKHLETADPSIFPEYNLCEMDVIKGEALAVRGLMHFDLVRLFGESPAVDMNKKSIPYHTNIDSLFVSANTVSEILNLVEKDLMEASRLLEKNDTDDQYGRSYMTNAHQRFLISNSSRNYFFTGRGARLNYVACQSLLARVYSYEGRVKEAAEVADSLLENYVDKSSWYRFSKEFTDTDNELSRPHKMIDELLVCFYDNNLVKRYTDDAVVKDASNPYIIKNMKFLFPDNDDNRKKLFYSVDRDHEISLKFMERKAVGNLVQFENRLLPIMRLSELYLISAEGKVAEGNIAAAAKAINQVRIKKGCMGNAVSETAKPEDIETAIRYELMREYVAEGQYFFFCKKINAKTINNNGKHIQMSGKYTLDIPDSETDLNN